MIREEGFKQAKQLNINSNSQQFIICGFLGCSKKWIKNHHQPPITTILHFHGASHKLCCKTLLLHPPQSQPLKPTGALRFIMNGQNPLEVFQKSLGILICSH